MFLLYLKIEIVMIQFTNSYESQFSSIAMVFYNGGGAILKNVQRNAQF